jgi:hypothetical protein
MARLFDRLQNLEGERNLDWIKVDAAKKKATKPAAGGRPKQKNKRKQ